MYTTQKEIRAAFWQEFPHLNRKKVKMGSEMVYKTDTRVAFCDFVECLARNGSISSSLAQRATL